MTTLAGSMPEAFYRCFCHLSGAWRRMGCPWHDREASALAGKSYKNQLPLRPPLASPSSPPCPFCGDEIREPFFELAGKRACYSCGSRGALAAEGGC